MWKTSDRKEAGGPPPGIRRAGIMPATHWSTPAVHGGEERQKARSALTDPIFLAATYTFADTQSLLDFIVQKQPREEYARYGNPTEKTAERKLAALEGAEAAVLYSTRDDGHRRAAAGQLRAGRRDRAVRRVLPADARLLPAKSCRRFGITTRLVPAGDYDALEAAITPATRLLLSESPTNPHLSVIDLERFAAIGRQARRRDGDRRHAGHALQRPPAGVRRRLRAALLHEVPRRAQRPAGRRGAGAAGEAGAAAEIPRPAGPDQRPAQRAPPAPRPEDLRAADAAAQRQRPGAWPSSWPATRGSSGSIIPGCRAIRSTSWPGGRCGDSAAW